MKKNIMHVIVFLAIIFISLMSGCISQSYANSWATEMMQINKLHDLGLYGSGITLGIIDTGVETDHGDFDISTFLSWHDYVNNLSSPYDDEGHGTHIAGILFARGSWLGSLSGYNLQGVCPDARGIVVKVTSKTGECRDEDVARAINFCADNGADIILLSLGESPETLDIGKQSFDACVNAINQGIIIVVPAGDDGLHDDGDVNIFSNVSEVISVGSIRRDRYISAFSSRGNQAWVPGEHEERVDPDKKPELVAPGENIISTYLDGGYIGLSGTSQAAAYVAGTIALLLEAYPELNKSKENICLIKEVLAKTAKKVGGNELYNGEPLSHNDRYGYGLIQAYNAYVELSRYVEG